MASGAVSLPRSRKTAVPGTRGCLAVVELVDELMQRTLASLAVGGYDRAATLPGDHDGEGGKADQQGRPGAVSQLGQVGREEQPVHDQQGGRADAEYPPRGAPFDAGHVEEQQGRDGRRRDHGRGGGQHDQRDPAPFRHQQEERR